jgi:hypothetical protein
MEFLRASSYGIYCTFEVIKSSLRMKQMYIRISRSHGKNTARVVVARQMLKIIYYMLRDKRAFIGDKG